MNKFVCTSSNNIPNTDNSSEIGRCCDSQRKQGIDTLVHLPTFDVEELLIDGIEFSSDNSELEPIFDLVF